MAPAIGCAAAFGVVLSKGAPEAYEVLAKSRPTAVNLFWALERMKKAKDLEQEALAIFEEDLAANREIGRLGAELIRERARVMTHCNTGALATAGYGTALAPLLLLGPWFGLERLAGFVRRPGVSRRIARSIVLLPILSVALCNLCLLAMACSDGVGVPSETETTDQFRRDRAGFDDGRSDGGDAVDEDGGPPPPPRPHTHASPTRTAHRESPTPLPARSGGNALAAPIKKTCPWC